MISTNAGGVHAVRYGTVRQMVLGLEAVLADGSILSGMRGLRKDNTGYDWKQLLIGSEGTLGIVTAALLRLVPRPSDRAVAWVSVADTQDALDLLERCQDELGDAVTAFELMSSASVARVTKHLGRRPPVADARWHVLVEVADCAPDVRGRLERTLAAAAEAEHLEDAAIATSGAQCDDLWALRENMGEAEKLAGPSLTHDVAVTVSDVPAFLGDVTSALAALDPALDLNAFGHLGDGNIHVNVLTAGATASHEAVHRTVHDVVARYDGSIAAEHGIGQYRVDELLRLKESSEIALMRTLKSALDPGNLLNPGKVLPRG
jgi:FAD/FMN-containing dehydrogenase